jgi:hypothetical protein
VRPPWLRPAARARPRGLKNGVNNDLWRPVPFLVPTKCSTRPRFSIPTGWADGWAVASDGAAAACCIAAGLPCCSPSWLAGGIGKSSLHLPNRTSASQQRRRARCADPFCECDDGSPDRRACRGGRWRCTVCAERAGLEKRARGGSKVRQGPVKAGPPRWAVRMGRGPMQTGGQRRAAKSRLGGAGGSSLLCCRAPRAPKPV